MPQLSKPRFSGLTRPSLPGGGLRRPSFRRPGPPVPPSLWSERARRAAAALAIFVVAAIGFGLGFLVFDDPATTSTAEPAGTSVVVADGTDGGTAAQLAFPELATRNTTRVDGADPTIDAAGVALASYPSQAGVGAAFAAVLAPAGSWQAARAATPLTADPVAAPLLLGGATELPAITTQALTLLAPQGLDAAGGAQVIIVGDVLAPSGFEPLTIGGRTPDAIADAVDVQRAKLSGVEDPDHLLVVSSDEAAYAMPAAAWAARSGDPVLFAADDEVPKGTIAAIKRHPDTPIYVLGPESVISAKALDKLGKKGAPVTRVGAEDPIDNAITFARFVDGDFGWNINDPGHGFVIANTSRPLDAAAAAPLAAGGKPGPLLLTDSADAVPAGLKAFLTDTEPGFIDDPARAVFNHIWLMGDASAISLPFQALVDQLTKLAPVSGGTQAPASGTGIPVPTTPTAPPSGDVLPPADGG